MSKVKVFWVSAEITFNDGIVEERYIKVRARNSVKACEFFKRDIVNLYHLYSADDQIGDIASFEA